MNNEGNGSQLSPEDLRRAIKSLKKADEKRTCAICHKPEPDSIATMPVSVHNECFKKQILAVEGLLDTLVDDKIDEEWE